ncbi:MAG: hypothetical protein JNL62_10835 [Bryobacterales bacterium]|nr:hypothetical protein [Bryobacterales bacterium]
MPFRVKDILIDVLQPQPCPNHTLITCHFHCTHLISCHFGCSLQISCHFGCSLQISCQYHSLVTCHLYCTQVGSICPGGSIVCPGGSIACPGGSIACGGSIFEQTPVDPAVIRERMKAEIAAAQAAEEVLAEAMRPQTLEQVDLLEGKLKEALADLGRRREELSKKK